MSHPFELLTADRCERARFENRCALTVMAKAPVPGKVKTRLSPPLTPEQAAHLNEDFLRDTIASLRAAAEQVAAECVVSYTPAGQEAAFLDILPASTLLLAQRGSDFGERLLTTAQDLFKLGFAAVCLIDSDSPTVPTAAYVQAVTTLLQTPETDAVVLGPAFDGGYYLLGINRPHAHLFAEIAWSTDRVAQQTEQRAAALGLRVTRLETWFDVDDAASLARLRRALSELEARGYAAPWTRRSLDRIDEQERLSAMADEEQPVTHAAR